MRFLFRPPADEAAGLLALPWHQPLEEWDDERPARGPAARHLAARRPVRRRRTVRSTRSRRSTSVWRGTNTRCSREFEEEGLPTVSVLGICVDRPNDLAAILVTRYPRVLDVLPRPVLQPARPTTPPTS